MIKLVPSSKVLIFVAHPDDAEICMGGTIKKLSMSGLELIVAIATSSADTQMYREFRMQAAESSAKILGHSISWLENGRLNQVESLPEYEWVRIIDDLIKIHAPSIVFSHSIDDSHGDHRRLAFAVQSAMRMSTATFISIPPSELKTQAFRRFVSNITIDISSTLNDKIRSLECFNQAGDISVRKIDIERLEMLARLSAINSPFTATEEFRLERVYID
jgi:N-acetylglucosamine malate deacetylase 1